jgi:excisionase family DNA binding protein
MSEILTIREFANAVKVGIPTVRRWINDGLIPIFRAGYVIRIDKQSALEALSNRKPNLPLKPRRGKPCAETKEPISA